MVCRKLGERAGLLLFLLPIIIRDTPAFPFALHLLGSSGSIASHYQQRQMEKGTGPCLMRFRVISPLLSELGWPGPEPLITEKPDHSIFSGNLPRNFLS